MLTVRGLGKKIKQFQRILTFYAKVKKNTTQNKKATTQDKKDISGTKGQNKVIHDKRAERAPFWLCLSLSARGVLRGTRRVQKVDEYKRNGDSENVAHLKVQNVLLPLYRKKLRKVLLECLQWMRAMKKDYTFQEVMETQKDLKDTDGLDWLESTELAIDKRKFLLNRMFVKQPIPQDED